MNEEKQESRVFVSEAEPTTYHPGDLWFQVDADGNLIGIFVLAAAEPPKEAE